MRQVIATVALLACSCAAHAQFPPEKLTPMGEKIVAAMKSDIRTAEEKERDGERLPRQTLEFFGLREDMRVVELVPGGGFYTKILAQVLADKGELYEAQGMAYWDKGDGKWDDAANWMVPRRRSKDCAASDSAAGCGARARPQAGPPG